MNNILLLSSMRTVWRRAEQLEHAGQRFDEMMLIGAAVGARQIPTVLREERIPVIRIHHQPRTLVTLKQSQKHTLRLIFIRQLQTAGIMSWEFRTRSQIETMKRLIGTGKWLASGWHSAAMWNERHNWKRFTSSNETVAVDWILGHWLRHKCSFHIQVSIKCQSSVIQTEKSAEKKRQEKAPEKSFESSRVGQRHFICCWMMSEYLNRMDHYSSLSNWQLVIVIVATLNQPRKKKKIPKKSQKMEQHNLNSPLITDALTLHSSFAYKNSTWCLLWGDQHSREQQQRRRKNTWCPGWVKIHPRASCRIDIGGSRTSLRDKTCRRRWGAVAVLPPSPETNSIRYELQLALNGNSTHRRGGAGRFAWKPIIHPAEMRELQLIHLCH